MVTECNLRGLPAWTLKHAHFLIMGGFHIVEPSEDGRPMKELPEDGETGSTADTPSTTLLVDAATTDTERGQGLVTILTLELLRRLVQDPEFRIQITEEEIQDKSKGDALSKVIFIFQSTWFILQCLGRLSQRLGLTHLELSTLALASMNGITFVLWWDKLLGAQTAVRLELGRRLTDAERNVSKLPLKRYYCFTCDCSKTNLWPTRESCPSLENSWTAVWLGSVITLSFASQKEILLLG